MIAVAASIRSSSSSITSPSRPSSSARSAAVRARPCSLRVDDAEDALAELGPQVRHHPDQIDAREAPRGVSSSDVPARIDRHRRARLDQIRRDLVEDVRLYREDHEVGVVRDGDVALASPRRRPPRPAPWPCSGSASANSIASGAPDSPLGGGPAAGQPAGHVSGAHEAELHGWNSIRTAWRASADQASTAVSSATAPQLADAWSNQPVRQRFFDCTSACRTTEARHPRRAPSGLTTDGTRSCSAERGAPGQCSASQAARRSLGFRDIHRTSHCVATSSGPDSALDHHGRLSRRSATPRLRSPLRARRESRRPNGCPSSMTADLEQRHHLRPTP